MIYITQLIYVKRGEEDSFHEFESHAIPIISKYNGKLLLRVRPDTASYIENSIESPYEMHIISFDDDSDLDRFMADEERKKYLHLKEKSIQSSILIKGFKI